MIRLATGDGAAAGLSAEKLATIAADQWPAELTGVGRIACDMAVFGRENGLPDDGQGKKA